MTYRSGPGRKWLVFVGVAAFWVATWSISARSGGFGSPIQLGRVLFAAAFLLAAANASRCGVVIEDDCLVIRLWRKVHRLRLDELKDVELALVDPHVVAGDGTRITLLDCWHPEPGEVAAEVRRRWHAARMRASEPVLPDVDIWE